MRTRIKISGCHELYLPNQRYFCHLHNLADAIQSTDTARQVMTKFARGQPRGSPPPNLPIRETNGRLHALP